MIIDALVSALEPLSYVHALWEGGAAAFNRIDEWSDIDVYMVVDDERVDDGFSAVEKALASLSPIKEKYETGKLPWPDVHQAFYRLEAAGDYLLIDLAVLTLSSPEKFLDPKIHGNNVFHFNKAGKVQCSTMDPGEFAKKLSKRLKRLRARFGMFNIFVQKEINRGNSLQAIDLYHGITLASLLEVTRIRHNPFHHNFRTHYANHELPTDVIRKLERLYFVKDLADLQGKYEEASTRFMELMKCLQQEERGKTVEGDL
jgi:hypothetical protein